MKAGGQRLWCEDRQLHNLIGAQERGGVSLKLPRLGTVHAVANVHDSAQHPGATSNAVWSTPYVYSSDAFDAFGTVSTANIGAFQVFAVWSTRRRR